MMPLLVSLEGWVPGLFGVYLARFLNLAFWVMECVELCQGTRRLYCAFSVNFNKTTDTKMPAT